MDLIAFASISFMINYCLKKCLRGHIPVCGWSDGFFGTTGFLSPRKEAYTLPIYPTRCSVCHADVDSASKVCVADDRKTPEDRGRPTGMHGYVVGRSLPQLNTVSYIIGTEPSTGETTMQMDHQAIQASTDRGCTRINQVAGTEIDRNAQLLSTCTPRDCRKSELKLCSCCGPVFGCRVSYRVRRFASELARFQREFIRIDV